MNLDSVLGGLRDLFRKSPEREGRVLARDAAAIIDVAEQYYRSEIMRDVAVLARKHVREATTHTTPGSVERERALDHFRREHRESKRRGDQVALTGYTLVIIYLRAQALAESGQEAMDTISALLERWGHVEPTGNSPGDTLSG